MPGSSGSGRGRSPDESKGAAIATPLDVFSKQKGIIIMKSDPKPKISIVIGYVYQAGKQHFLVLGYTKNKKVVYAKNTENNPRWEIGGVCSKQRFAKLCSEKLEKVTQDTLRIVKDKTQASKKIRK